MAEPNGNGQPSQPSGQNSMVQSAILPAKFSEDNTSRAAKSSFGAESTMSLLVDSLKDRLLLAVPKKGRLHEKCVELLTGESDITHGGEDSESELIM
jgi:ATP phosphoribosyltransferase